MATMHMIYLTKVVNCSEKHYMVCKQCQNYNNIMVVKVDGLILYWHELYHLIMKDISY